MLLVHLENIFEIIMTQLGLFDIYTDVAFAAIANKEGLTLILGSTCFSLIMICIPKLYAFVVGIMITFRCIREEDTRRK
jgi:hypothetical protein